jgi:site-specific DNA recombinase
MARSSAPRHAAGDATPVAPTPAKNVRCAIYTRKSTEEGLQQEFNSLDAQREAAEAFVLSQKSEGWRVAGEHYDDGGYTGGNMDRPALKRLLAAVEERTIDCVVVYKVDRLSRSLLDFARMMEVFDRNGISFVSVTGLTAVKEWFLGEDRDLNDSRSPYARARDAFRTKDNTVGPATPQSRRSSFKSCAEESL